MAGFCAKRNICPPISANRQYAKLYEPGYNETTNKMTNKKRIRTTGSILVNKTVESVFDFFANPSNDNLWRTEINEVTLGGPLQLGVTISEHAYLSKSVPNNLTALKCVLFDKNNLAIFETQENAPFYMKSQRQVKAISDHTTEIVYTLDFDMGLVKYALGIALPKFIVSFKADSDLKKYLRQLKAKLEND
jgi:hypothetical protein